MQTNRYVSTDKEEIQKMQELNQQKYKRKKKAFKSEVRL